MAQTASAAMARVTRVNPDLPSFSRLLIWVSSLIFRVGGNRLPMETTLGFRPAGIAAVRHWGFVPQATIPGAARRPTRRVCAKSTFRADRPEEGSGGYQCAGRRLWMRI